ncbi:MAG: hypothetical protein ACYCO4_00475 [Sulfobacillus sp.]
MSEPGSDTAGGDCLNPSAPSSLSGGESVGLGIVGILVVIILVVIVIRIL